MCINWFGTARHDLDATDSPGFRDQDRAARLPAAVPSKCHSKTPGSGKLRSIKSAAPILL
jgi:hypothetical protein